MVGKQSKSQKPEKGDPATLKVKGMLARVPKGHPSLQPEQAKVAKQAEERMLARGRPLLHPRLQQQQS